MPIYIASVLQAEEWWHICSPVEVPLERTSVCEVLFYYAWTPIPLPDNYKGRFPWSQVSDRK